MCKILIAEKDEKLRQLFEQVLQKHGYETVSVWDFRRAAETLKSQAYSLCVCDASLLMSGGYELVRELQKTDIPVLLLMAKNFFSSRWLTYSRCTDDYIVRPVEVQDLLSKVKTLLERSRMLREGRQVIGETVLEQKTLSVCCRDTEVVLPQEDFMLLFKMAARPNKFFTHQQLIDAVWGKDGNGNIIGLEKRIAKLREALAGNQDLRIVSLRGLGCKVVTA